MRSSDAANRPRWSGQAGFFEIWFLVVFEAAARRAWWLRYILGAADYHAGSPERFAIRLGHGGACHLARGMPPVYRRR